MNRIERESFNGTGAEWNMLVAGLPGAHLLQTWEWAQVKAAFGWHPMPLIWRLTVANAAGESRDQPSKNPIVAAAMVLRRPVLSRGFLRRLSLVYVPKGPLLDPNDLELGEQVLSDLEFVGRQQGAILVKIDPDVALGRGFPGAEMYSDDPTGQMWAGLVKGRGWRFSDAQVQFRNSVCIDLDAPADVLIGRMKQKARYNIRIAERKGVSVRTGTLDDLPQLFRMYQETAERDGFTIRSEDYYQAVWRAFLGTPQHESQPRAEALIAEVEGEAVAALWLFHFAGRAYYLYGMSRAAHREKMPNYLLQWEAIRRAQQLGCRTYDLWGAPENFDEADSMWGVFRFKEGLGGYVVRTPGAWDYPAGGIWYRIYSQLAPRVLDAMRWRGRRRAHDAPGGA